MKTPREQAGELYIKWINGNRKEVLRALTAMSSMRAACVAAHFMRGLCEGMGRGPDADLFVKTMEARLDR